jgi:hypothetical protein
LPQPNSDGFAIGNAYSDSYGYGNAHSDSDANCNSNSYGNSNGHSYAHTDANSYGYSYVHTDGYGNSNSYGNSDLNADSNGGEAIADAETASNNTATASVVGSGKWNSSGRNSRETLASSPPEVDWLPLIFARSALGVRCVLASLLRRMKLSPQGACVI